MASDVAVAGSAWLWWNKSSGSLLKGENPLAYESTSGGVALGLLAMTGVLFAAKLGGDLVYDYGMGLSVGKKSQKKKV